MLPVIVGKPGDRRSKLDFHELSWIFYDGALITERLVARNLGENRVMELEFNRSV